LEGDKPVKPAYWIGIMALVGALIGYGIRRMTGWLDTGVGTAIGVAIGVVIYERLTERSRGGR
jgi:uncharacterized membrane protein (UPF0136 family)